MAGIIISLSVISIIFLIFIQKTELRIFYNEALSIEIDYSLFKIVLRKSEKKALKDEKKTNKKSKKTHSRVNGRKAAKELLKRADVYIKSVVLKSAELEPHLFSVRSRNVFSLFNAFTAYIGENSKKLTLSNSPLRVTTDPDESFLFDATLSFRLYDILTVIFMLIINMIKSQARKIIKRSTKNV